MTTTQVYTIYIKTTPEKLWEAITTPEWTTRYGYGGFAEFNLKPGGAYQSVADPGLEAGGFTGVAIDGEVIEADPPRTLVQTWRMCMDPTAKDEGFTTLTYDISEVTGGVKLQVTHDVTGAPTVAAMLGGGLEDVGGGGGWAWVLSDLKSLLETGSALGR